MKVIDQEEGLLFKEYQVARMPREKERIFQKYEHIVEKHAKRFSGRALPYDDSYQVAAIALLKAIDRYDPDRGVPFKYYAAPTISGALKNYVRDNTHPIKLPRDAYEMLPSLFRATAELTTRLNRMPTHQEIAEFLHQPVDKVEELLQVAGLRSVPSLQEQIKGNKGETEETRECLIGTDDPSLAIVEESILVREALASLTPRERHVLSKKVLDTWTQKEIGDEIGVSQMQISRILAAARKKLKQKCEYQ